MPDLDHLPEVDEVHACADCGQEFALRDDEPLGESHCEDCAIEYQPCDECGDVTRCSSLNSVGDDFMVCNDCMSDYSYCEECEESYNVRYASDHAHREERGDSRIHDYSYKPEPRFHHVAARTSAPAPGAYYVGFELEMESCDASFADAIDNIEASPIGRLVYFKHDSSLDDGMEMVSHPMSRDYVAQLDLRVLDTLRHDGWRSWDTVTAGMHVHVSRTAFQELRASSQEGWANLKVLQTRRSHLWRFTQLIVDNVEGATKFAGRNTDHIIGHTSYATFRNMKYATSRYIAGKRDADGHHIYPDRGAVNLGNSETVEVRMFRGTLNRRRVMANLEFVFAAVEYTRPLTSGQVVRGALAWKAFYGWVVAHRDLYPHLAAILANTEQRGAA